MGNLLGERLAEILKGEAGPLLKGAGEDVDRYLKAIGESLAGAIDRGDTELTAELQAQLRALVEKHRVRANEGALAALAAAARVVLKTVLAVSPALLCGLLLLAGCTPPGTVLASEIAPLTRVVAERHDAYVRADQTLTEQRRADYLRSTEILLSVLEAAQSGAAAARPPR